MVAITQFKGIAAMTMFMSTSLFHLVLGPAQYRKEGIELG